MSEYQYYEFRALDRPLDQKQLAALRAISSRAQITPTQFVNIYNFGDFRGNPAALMEQYFDFFVYVANWGTHQLMLRLPRRVLNPAVAMPYCNEDGAQAREAGDFVILEYLAEEDGGGGWFDSEEGPKWTTALLPLRDALAAGDLRALYLGWLSSIQYRWLDEETGDDAQADGYEDGEQDTMEPPVPPGMRALSEPLQALADFLHVDEDLIAIASEGSADLEAAGHTRDALESWIANLSESEKNLLLLRLVADGDTLLQAELLQRFRRAMAAANVPTERRTVTQLLAAARAREQERKRREAERLAQEHARKQRAAAAARAEHLARLAGQESVLWQQVGKLVAAKRPAEYDKAITLLKDLRDLAARSGQTADFTTRLRAVRAEHARKSNFMQRLDQAKLGAP